MSEACRRHRLEGFEPDNLLAFLALLGLLRALDTVRKEWCARAAWDLDRPPLRPILQLAQPMAPDVVSAAAAEGVARLLALLDFGEATDLKLTPDEARTLCRKAGACAEGDTRYFADLCAALISDAAVNREATSVTPTPLAYPSVARVNFLQSVKAIAEADLPEKKNRARDPSYPKDPAACLAQALFQPWKRLDRPAGLRWDPDEAKRHAYQWRAPTDEAPTTQHGAHRLAIVGLSVLTAAPVEVGPRINLAIAGGGQNGDAFTFAWPIWIVPASLAAIRALLSHPELRTPGALLYLGVDHVRVTRRISLDRYRNFTCAEPLVERKHAGP